MKRILPFLLLPIFIAGTAFAAPNDLGLVTVDDLDDASITNMQDENIGEIEELLLDPQSGRIRYAVIEVNKAWALNDPEVLVPYALLKVQPNQHGAPEVKIDATKEKLEQAPKYNERDARQLHDRQTSEPVFSYWGVTWED
jgi:PRC-barrel domain.